jgi:[ribosomal protein S5]-alanine N-acetyltransferase
MKNVISERLLFRLLNEQDVTSRYVGWLNDPEVNSFLETRFVKQSLESCREYVSCVENDPLSHLFGIFDKKSLEHIGNIKLGFINEHHKSAQISLFIGEKNWWGKGYATESIRVITNWGFDELELERIEAGCYDSNVGSLRAFLKVGYSVEGYLRGGFVSGGKRIGGFWMGMLRTDRNV